MNPLPGRAFLIRGSLATRADLPRRDGSRLSEPRIRKAPYLLHTIDLLYTILTEKSMYGTTKEKGPKNRPFFALFPPNPYVNLSATANAPKEYGFITGSKSYPLIIPAIESTMSFVGPFFPTSA